MRIVRRYGASPAERGSATGQSCPDVLELDGGSFLVIGKAPGVPNISARELSQHSASIGPDEQAVILPRDAMHAAARDIVSPQQAAAILAADDTAVNAIYEGWHDTLCRAQGPECGSAAPLLRDAIRAGLLRAQQLTAPADDAPREHP
jgi:hypothetical protein